MSTVISLPVTYPCPLVHLNGWVVEHVEGCLLPPLAQLHQRLCFEAVPYYDKSLLETVIRRALDCETTVEPPTVDLWCRCCGAKPTHRIEDGEE
jgi:hypothetical protein